MIDGSSSNEQRSHKEEGAARKRSDAIDRKGIREKLATAIDPLDPAQHPENIVNIVTGKIAVDGVNVDNACEIGVQQQKLFEESFPYGFHNPISKKVTTMQASKKHLKIGDEKCYDTNLIYSCLIGLQASSHDVDVLALIGQGLAPVPISMFDEAGDIVWLQLKQH